MHLDVTRVFYDPYADIWVLNDSVVSLMQLDRAERFVPTISPVTAHVVVVLAFCTWSVSGPFGLVTIFLEKVAQVYS